MINRAETRKYAVIIVASVPVLINLSVPAALFY